ncbi:SbtR family transcriptional regulator [Streptomyces mirabilis]
MDHAAVGEGMAATPESIMATDSPVFDNARSRMALALDRLLAAGAAAGTIRGGVHGRTVLRAPGGICGMHATEGWRDYAVRITALLFGGLRRGAEVAAQQAMAFGYLSSASV